MVLNRWGRRGGISLVDQAVHGGTNFLINIILARWLSPNEYGAFAVAYTIFLLIGAIHTSVMIEPMMVYGAKKYIETFRGYIGSLLLGHGIFSVLVSFILIVSSLAFLAFDSNELSDAFLGLAIASPFILLQWMIRRSFYVVSRSAWALAGSCMYFILNALAIFLLFQKASLTPYWAFLSMGLIGLLVSVCQLRILKPEFKWTGPLSLYSIFHDHKEFGAWNIVGTIIKWASTGILTIMVSAFLGLKAAGVLSVVRTLFRPLDLMLNAVSLVALPVLSSVQGENASVERRKKMRDLLWLVSGTVTLYGILLSSFSEFILHYLYKGLYDGHRHLFVLISLSFVASSFVFVFTLGLKSIGITREIAKIWSTSAIVVFVGSIPMINAWGIPGALTVQILSVCIAGYLAWLAVRQKIVA